MIRLRRMNSDDIPLGMRLKRAAGWNQLADDWRRFLSLQPDGCFVAEWNGTPVATTTTCVFDTIGWIAMVLVDPQYRGRGIAARLMEQALAFLDAAGVETSRLDATPLGQPVYQRLGFVVEYELTRFELEHPPVTIAGAQREKVRLKSISKGAWHQVSALDREATGTKRLRLLKQLAESRRESGRLAEVAGVCQGYALLRDGSRALQLGPCVATTRSAGQALCDWALAQCAGRGAFVDIPLANREAVRWAEAQRFRPQRPLMRMRRGPAVADRPKLIWASSGPEMG